MVRHNTFNKVISSRKAKLGLTGLASTAAMAAFFVASGGTSWAAVGGPSCNVPGDYATIQAAVDDVGCNTVKVAAGSYTESVTVGRQVTIKGAKAGSSVDNRTFGGVKESTLTGVGGAVFTINAANVTIDGFSVTNPNQGGGVVVKTAGNNAVIKNNIVDTIGGVAFASNPVGVYLENGPDSVKVSDNKFNNIQSVPSGQAILVGDSTASDPSLKTLIRGNSISNITSSTKGAYGIQVNNGASTAVTATGYSEVKIVDNTIKNLTGNWAHAIGLEGETPNATVRRNVVSNLTDTNPVPAADVIGVNFEDNQFFFTSDVNRNSLNVGAAGYGVAINPALTTAYPSLSLDATCNWWGAANGPGAVGSGSGSKVTTGVDYNPWLKSNRLDGKCSDNNHHDYWNGDDWDWGHDNR